MPETAGPREVFARLLHGICDRIGGDLADLYAEDAVIEVPFAVGRPSRLQGRETLRQHFSAAVASTLRVSAREVVVHSTDDPELIIAEWVYDGRVTTTDRTFSVANVQILRVRDGLIVSTRDYHDHLAIATAMGQLPTVVSSLESS